MEMDEKIYSIFAEMEETHWWFVARRHIYRSLLSQLMKPGQDHLVIDIGCGTGSNTGAFSEMYRCIGIDPSSEGIAYAKKRFPGISFICGSAPDDLGEEASIADVFVLNDVLEHARDDFHLLSSLVSSAKPGSYFVLTVPANMALWSGHDVSHHHLRRYNRERLVMIWENLPVTELLVSYYSARLYPIIRTMRTISRITGHTFGHGGTDWSIPPRLVNRALTKIFSGEANRLSDVLAGKRAKGYSFGSCLVAILRREEGVAEAKLKPLGIAPDPHDPSGH